MMGTALFAPPDRYADREAAPPVPGRDIPGAGSVLIDGTPRRCEAAKQEYRFFPAPGSLSADKRKRSDLRRTAVHLPRQIANRG